jgi:membrane protein
VTLLMVFLFKVLPRAKTGWGDIWLGAFITAFLFSIGKFAVGMYLGRSGTSSSYGAAAGFVVLLLWIYYSAQIFLFGAQFTALRANRHLARSDHPPASGKPPGDEAHTHDA